VEPGAGLSQAAWEWLFNNYTGDLDRTLDTTAAIICPPDKWFADLLPSGGPVLGPYDTRDDALAAEVVWLDEHNIPVPAAKSG